MAGTNPACPRGKSHAKNQKKAAKRKLLQKPVDWVEAPTPESLKELPAQSTQGPRDVAGSQNAPEVESEKLLSAGAGNPPRVATVPAAAAANLGHVGETSQPEKMGLGSELPGKSVSAAILMNSKLPVSEETTGRGEEEGATVPNSSFSEHAAQTARETAPSQPWYLSDTISLPTNPAEKEKKLAELLEFVDANTAAALEELSLPESILSELMQYVDDLGTEDDSGDDSSDEECSGEEVREEDAPFEAASEQQGSGDEVVIPADEAAAPILAEMTRAVAAYAATASAQNVKTAAKEPVPAGAVAARGRKEPRKENAGSGAIPRAGNLKATGSAAGKGVNPSASGSAPLGLETQGAALSSLGFVDVDFPPLSSPSVSRTLGEEDTSSSSSEEGGNSKVLKNGAIWTEMFANNRKLSSGLKLEQPKRTGKGAVIEEDDIEPGSKYDHSLVGYFSGRFPGMKAFHDVLKSWPVRCRHSFHKSGWIIFVFDKEEDMLRVLEDGPYMAFGRSLLLKRMPDFFGFDNTEITTFPIWVQLDELPLKLWSAKPLAKICAELGRPLYTDKLTANNDRVNFARVLVDIDVAKPLQHTVDVFLPDGSTHVQKVVYEKVPKFCPSCGRVGHAEEFCFKKAATKQVFAQKAAAPVQKGATVAAPKGVQVAAPAAQVGAAPQRAPAAQKVAAPTQRNAVPDQVVAATAVQTTQAAQKTAADAPSGQKGPAAQKAAHEKAALAPLPPANPAPPKGPDAGLAAPDPTAIDDGFKVVPPKKSAKAKGKKTFEPSPSEGNSTSSYFDVLA